ncbi:DUF1704 domain-containing protein [Candidatus Woesearchaeota archaeon]|jgi:uncharacterized protein (TIGR02421 family)|nr:DUF1704 domain-containing protein [Candidatus Woesearchaeota archaeon]MBT3304783.1 DUF1704 domain-containing protein [Candidatus Woesearchaeota archaeon]MBT4367881.1 DUF1704 domain-containing protein [Candidatus Woesearchaeota archaeon]MBT4712369.1 DUF1704 domain-containing protein [Candidatus Woesearchaeota archaeon]MBT6639281.1 DUF1704 domain-containing protein [Candidatus Woesearchaeota archaeon]
MKIRKEIRAADKILADATSQLPFSLINPINASYAKKVFMSNKSKNPTLKYTLPTTKLLALRQKLSSIAIEERDFLDTIIVERQRELIRHVDLLNSLGCFDFTEKSVKVFGLPSKKLINKAYRILNDKLNLKPAKKILKKDAVKILMENLRRFNLDYKIKNKDLVTSCSVESDKKLIILKQKERFSKNFINRLIVHEIGTHAFRYENGKKQELQIFKKGLAKYLITEEGLAVYNEERFGLLKKVFLQNYAGRVIAVNTAQKNSFFKTFRELRRFFDKNKAFQLTLRAKRGLVDTSLPGGFSKDYIYLDGYYQVKNFVSRGGNINDLYFGKIGLKDVKFVKELKLKKPDLLPESFTLMEKNG